MGRFGVKLVACAMSAAMLFSGASIPGRIDYVEAAEEAGENQIEVRECEKTKAAAGNIIVELEGMDYTSDMQEMLDRINQVRKEACEAGNVPNPLNPEEMLKPGDLEPLKYGKNCIKVAQIRAAEGSIKFSHERPNLGSGVNVLIDKGAQYAGENLAWTTEIESDLEGWIREKDDWIAQINDPNRLTGHYATIVNPNINYVGLSTFNPENDLYIGDLSCTAGEFAEVDTEVSEYASSQSDKVIQKIEIPASDVTRLDIVGKTILKLGETDFFEAYASAKYYGANRSNTVFDMPVCDGITWASNNPGIVSVNTNGLIEAKEYGTAIITAKIGTGENTKSVSREVIVIPEGVTVIGVDNPEIISTPSCTTPIINKTVLATLSNGSSIEVNVDWEMPSESSLKNQLFTDFTSKNFDIQGSTFGYEVKQAIRVEPAEVLEVYPDTDKEVIYAYSGVQPDYPTRAEFVLSNGWAVSGYNIEWKKECLDYYMTKEGGPYTMTGTVTVGTDNGNKSYTVEQKIFIYGNTVQQIVIDDSPINTSSGVAPVLPKAKVTWSTGEETDEDITWEETDSFLNGYKGESGTSYKIKGSYIKGETRKDVEITVNVTEAVIRKIVYDSSEITVKNGVNPKAMLPTTADVFWSNDKTETLGITWESIPGANYLNINGGKYKLNGIVAGTEISIFYNVNPANIVSISDIASIETVEGIAPQLPQYASVVWDNGMETQEAITWDGIQEEDYQYPDNTPRSVNGILKIRDKTVSTSYIVKEKSLVSLGWKMPEGTEGNPVGDISYDTYDISKFNGILVAKYDNGTSEDIDVKSNKITWNGYDPDSTNPSQELLFSYEYGGITKTASWTIHLYPKMIENITVSSFPVQRLGEVQLDLTDVMVVATYNSGEKFREQLDILVATNKAQIKSYDLSKIGTQSIEIVFDASYYTIDGAEKIPNDISKKEEITVSDKFITKFEFASTPSLVGYIIGQEVDLSKFAVKITYDDDSFETIKYEDFKENGISISGYEITSTGGQTILISKDKWNIGFDINVRDKEIKASSYYTLPRTTQFFKGQLFSMEGSQLHVEYDYGPDEDIDVDEELKSDHSRIQVVMSFGSEGEHRMGSYDDIGKLSVGSFDISLTFKNKPIKLITDQGEEGNFSINVWNPDKVISTTKDSSVEVSGLTSSASLDDIKQALNGQIVMIPFSGGARAPFIITSDMIDSVEDITEETATSQEKEGILSDIGDNQFVKKVKISIAENDKGEKIYTYKYLILDKDMVSGENGSSSGENGSGENDSENGGNSSSGENGSGGNGSNDNKTDNGTGGNGSDDKSSENGNGGNSSETGDNGKEGGAGGSSTEDKKTTESPDKKADEDSRDTEEGTAKVGSVVTSGGAKYKVTASNSVSYKAPTKASATGVVVPASVKINGKVYKVTTVEAKAFKGNTKLTKVVIGKNVQTVGKNAFAGCTNLTTVTFGSNVTTIGDGAFSGCKKLTKVVIPGKVKKIGKKAFYKCTNLKKIIIKTKKLGKKSIGANAFKGINKKAAVSVPKAKKKAYTKYLRKAGLPKNSKIK